VVDLHLKNSLLLFGKYLLDHLLSQLQGMKKRKDMKSSGKKNKLRFLNTKIISGLLRLLITTHNNGTFFLDLNDDFKMS
jgi:hypothetical protein